jgi:hypothetical protein
MQYLLQSEKPVGSSSAGAGALDASCLHSSKGDQLESFAMLPASAAPTDAKINP